MRAPVHLDHAHVDFHHLAVLPACGKLFDIAVNIETARDIVGRAERQNRQRHRAARQDAPGASDGAIATRHHHAFSVAEVRGEIRLIIDGTNH